MKRKIKMTFLLFFILISIWNIKSLATFFEIENYTINCELLENGNLKVQENITYNTDEYRNGVTRTINTKNKINMTNSADLLTLESVKVNNEEYSRVSTSSNGRTGVYEYKISDEQYNIKVYSPFQYEGKTITYEYTLENVGVVYNDTAELYWNFIGDGWDTQINNVEINITLPRNAAQDTIYVYGHGSDNGTFTKDMNNITLKAKDLSKYQALDARILFNKNALQDSTKVVNKNVLSKYRKQEEGFTKNREEEQVLGIFTKRQIISALIIVIIVIWVTVYLMYDKEYEVKSEKYFRDIPYDFDPELIQYIYYGRERKNTLWITFLDSLKKGVYSIEKITNKVGVETYNIIYNKEPSNLKKYQKNFINLLDKYMKTDKDGTKSVDLLTLKAKMANASSTKYKEYLDALKEEKEILFGETKKAPKIAIIIPKIIILVILLIIAIISIKAVETFAALPIIICFIAITFIYTKTFKTIQKQHSYFLIAVVAMHFTFFMVFIIVLLNTLGLKYMFIPYILALAFNIYVDTIKKESKEYRQARAQIKGLRNYLKDYSLISKTDVEHMSIWEEYFIVAVALKVNKKATNYLYDCCNQLTNNLNFSNSLSACTSFDVFDSTISRPFNTYVSSYVYSSSSGSSSSSYSGSSGGFSSGSSSGRRGPEAEEEEVPSKKER